MPAIKAVIFDMDGVLIDSLPEHYRTLRNMFSELGVRYDISEYETMDITAGVMNLIPRVLKEHNKKANVKPLIKKRESMININKIHLNPGVLKLLKALKKNKYKTAVASGGTRHFVISALKKNKIRRYFDAVVTGEDHVRKKPHPDIFLTAARKLKVKPRECLVIEDSHDGVTAAKRAGMKCVGHYVPKYRQNLLRADATVRSMSRINIKMIEGLTGKNE